MPWHSTESHVMLHSIKYSYRKNGNITTKDLILQLLTSSFKKFDVENYQMKYFIHTKLSWNVNIAMDSKNYDFSELKNINNWRWLNLEAWREICCLLLMGYHYFNLGFEMKVTFQNKTKHFFNFSLTTRSPGDMSSGSTSPITGRKYVYICKHIVTN